MKLFFFLACVGLACGKFPKTWKSCKGNKDVNKCLEGAIEGAIRSLKNGDHHLGMFPIDPLRFDAVDIDQGQGPVMINLKFRDLDLYGFSESKINNVSVQPDKGLIIFRVNLTKPFVVKGNYTMSGKVLIMPIAGKGRCTLTFENYSLVATIHGKSVGEGKSKTFQVDDFQNKIATSKLKMNFEGLFHGDKVMGDHMNKFLNENWQIILSELLPAISKGFGQGFKELANRVFSKIPLNEIY